MTFTIATCNVNGVRAAFRKGMGDWLKQLEADAVLLQEVRASDQILCDLVPQGWHVASLPSQIKGRAGVAVLTRSEQGEVVAGLGQDGEEGAHTGRWLEVQIEAKGRPLTLVSAYLHSGQVGTEKMGQKYQHLEWVSARLQELAKRELVAVCGDFNIVHTERDIKNWKGNHNKTAGVLDEEIAYLDRWFGDSWCDVARQLAGDQQGPYTWWSQRGKAFDNDAGWRIDYQMTTPALAEAAASFRVERAASYDARWSDHAPLIVGYDI